ncbi:hypothetical protein OV079_29270 [Nannocystis pusilla]|uniref:Uncharacterized protein n=1 Tax=Nannocystis pusilla TaxID=889268 RepID=A0A9X3EUM0_9BACT|nr:hypothetical protein [Nannocystis pusilla]MCY1009585.1 hypothetical protein [Nannocystis pusilla]
MVEVTGRVCVAVGDAGAAVKDAGASAFVTAGEAGASGGAEGEGVETWESDVRGEGTGCQAPMLEGLTPAIARNAVRVVSGTFKSKSSGPGGYRKARAPFM